ncbi:hypothetical protein ACFSC6_04610 [Rufibacter sediminis]|uniref:Lipoprotein n=1 Tax=Rufibacter sediminis TaxID=2762756 RepID=A0ABR6VS80_9BACT|nr:hypothetical protein [Rufibacter sediminis]MBC3539996.1 hypothetical protein [Rufibacter sediminis]
MRKLALVLLVFAVFQGCTEAQKGSRTEAESQREPESPSIYKRDRKFTFLASHFDKAGKLSDLDTLYLATSGEVFSEKYGQTWSSWASTGGDFGSNSTGITEQDTAVWIHPPRDGRYKKLELSPFPMVEFPLEAGHTWTWNLLIGGHYSIAGFAEWADHTNESFFSTYKITRKLPVQIPMGTFACYEIDSFTKSKFERTELKAYFNPEYGFVKLDYRNIDQTRLLMELIEVKYAQSGTKLPFKDIKIQ